jgi:hypothetical protein
MRKLIIMSVLSMVLFSSCRISKSITMLGAKNDSKLTKEQFINKKTYGISYLGLSADQLEKTKIIWSKEIEDLKKIELTNENIAPIIYNSEIEFRKILTDKQKESYPLVDKGDKTKFNEKIIDCFMNNRQLEEIKRIYKL